jgi:hypothetical protein
MTVTPTIVILDDEPDRIRTMTECLARAISICRVVTFDNAPDMIDWLEDHLEEANLICLDHDLGPNRVRNRVVFDPGTGRDVADFLATKRPVCPVLIHTTNSLAAPGMALAFDDANWQHSRVVPFNDLEWISEDWIDEVKNALKD